MLQRMLMGARPWLVWLLLWCPVERSLAGNAGKRDRKKKDEDAHNKVAIPHHSFAVPLAYEEVLNDWAVSGASLVERERLLLHPSVPERAAFVWSKAPLLTNDFEVTVQFRVVGPKDGDQTVLDQSFAMWYVHENVSASYNETAMIKAPSWKAGLEEFGMTLSGAKAKFQGFGAILSMADAQKKPKSVVSAVWNDGDRDLVYGKDVPTPDAKAVDFRNSMNAAQLRVRVTPTSIVGFFKQSPSLSWNECFKIDRSKDPMKPGGYLGFSAWSGTASPVTVSDMISIMGVEVNNFDTTSIGEEMKDVSKDIQEAYREMLTDEKRHFVDQASQTEHLSRLTQMLREHADSAHVADRQMFTDLETLQGRVGSLDDNCKTVVKELQILVNPDGSAGSGGNVKDSIIGLRRLLVKDSASHSAKLDMVQTKMKEVKQKHVDASKPEIFEALVNHGERIQSTVNASGSQTTWMMLGIVAAIVAVGFLMWNRMVYYERKHFL